MHDKEFASHFYLLQKHHEILKISNYICTDIVNTNNYKKQKKQFTKLHIAHEKILHPPRPDCIICNHWQCKCPTQEDMGLPQRLQPKDNKCLES
jgi:hypothetical protein